MYSITHLGMLLPVQVAMYMCVWTGKGHTTGAELMKPHWEVGSPRRMVAGRT